MKKGFTMVEVIGIIIVLGVIALISFPVFNNMIKNTQISNEKQQVKNVIDEANALYNEYLINGNQSFLIDRDIYDILSVKDKPQIGSVIINEYGNIKATIKIESRCYQKDFNDVDINIVDNELCD